MVRARAQRSADQFVGTRSVGIKLSEVATSGLRLEASAYALEARQALLEMKATQYQLVPVLGDNGVCSDAHNAFRFARMFVAEGKGVPFLSSSDIIGLRPERGAFLSHKTKKLADLQIEPWEVLVSCSGTVGNVSLASPRMAGWALSQHAIRITAPDEDTAGYVAAFLRSRWGRAQMAGLTYGSVIQHIEPSHLHRVLVPELPAIRRVSIGRAFVEAALKRDEANEKLDTADARLCRLLDLREVPAVNAGPLIRTVRASDLRGRFEATYHSPAAIWVEKELKRKKLSIRPLGDPELSFAVKAVTKFRKRVYVPHGGIPLLSSKQLFQVDPIEVKGLARGAHEDDLDEIALGENMVAVTCSGTIGRVQIIPRYMAGWAANQHALRIVAKTPQLAGYLFAWLSTKYGQALIARFSYGSVIQEIDRFMLADVPVPLLPAHNIEEVGELVLEANRLRDQAWALERGALRTLSSLLEEPQKS